MTKIRQLIRNGTRDLKILGFANGIDVDILTGAGCAKSVAPSYVGFETFGLAPNFRRRVERRELEVIEYAELGDVDPPDIGISKS